MKKENVSVFKTVAQYMGNFWAHESQLFWARFMGPITLVMKKIHLKKLCTGQLNL